MAGDQVFGYKWDSATGMVTQHTSRQLGYMYGHMARDGRLCLVSISTHTADVFGAGKTDNKEDLPSWC